MRVTSEMNFRLLSDAIRRQQVQLQQFRQQVATGKQVAKASDDPGAFGMIRNLSADQAQLKQHARNADMALQYNLTTGQGLTKAVNLMHRVNELAVQSGDGTLDDMTRGALAENVDALLKDMISVANGSEGGRYTFAGLRTDTPPYEAVLDPADGRIVGVTYVGSQETRAIQIGDSMQVATNLPGSTATSEGGIFQTATRDIFDSIIQLRDALRSGQEVPSSDIPERLQSDLDHLLNATSVNGAREEQIKMNKTYLLDMQASNLKSTEAFESVDLASAMIKLTQAENAYEAALGSASRMLQQVNLMNFI